MRRAAFLFACIMLLRAGSADARMSAIMMGGGGTAGSGSACGVTSEPAGDLFHDGFEAATVGFELNVCGSTPCWTKNTLTVPSDISSLTPPTESCDQGAQANVSASAAYGHYNLGSTVSGYYGRFSLYVVSHGLTTGQTTNIATAGSNTSGSNAFGSIQLYSSNGTALALRAIGAASTATITIATGTWYVVDYCLVDGSETGDFCGTGVNGKGWISINGGATRSEITCNDVAANTQYFLYGSITSSRTVNLHFGYVALDGNGTW